MGHVDLGRTQVAGTVGLIEVGIPFSDQIYKIVEDMAKVHRVQMACLVSFHAWFELVGVYQNHVKP
ncbi:MAG: hypothetical protein CYG60_24775, partial [Actinobacteria bacterium]